MRWQGVAYRAHDPGWAWAPASGEGAAAKGGRFNPVGVPALYLALTIEGMLLEVAHGFAHRFDPLTICSYDVDVDGLADLRDEAGQTAHHVAFEDLACAWAYERANARRPASWVVVDRLRANDLAGILVPSFARGARDGMANLVLWTWGDALPHQVRVHDRAERLPRNRASWTPA